jgi:hypothetical protein
MLFLFDVLYETKKQISAFDSSGFETFPRAKHGLSPCYHLHKKNLRFVECWPGRVLTSIPRLVGRYKHLMHNTVVGPLAGPVHVGTQRSLRRSLLTLRQNSSLMTSLRLRVEFIHLLLHFFSLPSRPHLSYFSLASFSGSRDRTKPSPTAIPGAELTFRCARLDLQLPKLRKSSYRRTSFFPVPPSLLHFPRAIFNLPFTPAFPGLRSSRFPSPPFSFSERFSLFDPRIHHNLSSRELLVRFHNSKAHNAYSFVSNLSRYAIAFLKKTRGKNKLQQLKNSVYSILRLLSSQRLSGLGFQYSGRIYGAKKASSFKMLIGSVPLNTLDAFIDYEKIMQKTGNGTWGFKVWICHDSTSLASYDNSALNFFRKGTLTNPNGAQRWAQLY